MGKKLCLVLLWLVFVPPVRPDPEVDFNSELTASEEQWTYRHKKQDELETACARLRPAARDIVRRFYAIIPYFDKEHANTAFLHKLRGIIYAMSEGSDVLDREEVVAKTSPLPILESFDKEHANTAFLHKLRGTIYAMSEGPDVLDREAAFYAAVLTPVVFLQQYRDTWCLLERFHRAIRLYQISHPTEKRSALKILQNLRAVTQKIRTFINELPSQPPTARTHLAADFEDEEIHGKKDIKFLTELIKNLG